ncbi:MAG: alpha/beta fold hydrolase [Deltaproteobacteria bacterium]|nr:alpha/beta fold hydrolase [Deltaproteobacteria bacterium]
MPKIQAGSIEIAYETYGNGETLLLIMGLGLPGTAWIGRLPFLTQFKCVYFDNRGTGNSDGPEGPYTIPQLADDASNLLDSLGIEKAKVYGFSMGGMIAQELALRHPAQVQKLVLGCTTPGGPHAVLTNTKKILEALSLQTVDQDGAADAILRLSVPPSFKVDEELKAGFAAVLKMAPPPQPQIIEKTLAGVLAFNAYDRLDEIKCPVMIVHGDMDILIPSENAALIKSKIPHAELFIVPNAGHYYEAADSAGINQRIARWLKG